MKEILSEKEKNKLYENYELLKDVLVRNVKEYNLKMDEYLQIFYHSPLYKDEIIYIIGKKKENTNVIEKVINKFYGLNGYDFKIVVKLTRLEFKKNFTIIPGLEELGIRPPFSIEVYETPKIYCLDLNYKALSEEIEKEF